MNSCLNVFGSLLFHFTTSRSHRDGFILLSALVHRSGFLWLLKFILKIINLESKCLQRNHMIYCTSKLCFKQKGRIDVIWTFLLSVIFRFFLFQNKVENNYLFFRFSWYFCQFKFYNFVCLVWGNKFLFGIFISLLS